MQDLAKVWSIDPMQIPPYTAPTHLMQMMRYAEEGSIRFLHISGTNPAVSLPELGRIRDILTQKRLFVVVQDIFLSETAQLADVVLPAATWGEKTGTFTNVDRTVHLSEKATVHLSEKAVEPPGEARPDLDIFIDLAHRLDITDKDSAPLVKWSDAEGAFEAWKECSARRPCDYTGLSCEKLRGGSGIQWPCTEEHPEGTERIYVDGQFWSDPDYCESYGRDMVTGAPQEPDAYRAMNPLGKALLKAAEYLPPHEPTSEDFPFALITGRTLYHFHTRTKTGRAPQLQAAAPEVWVEMAQSAARGPWLVRGRPAPREHTTGAGRRPAAGQRHTPRGPLPPVPLRLLRHAGCTRAGREGRASRQRADDHGLGPGLQTAAVQDCSCEGRACPQRPW